MPQPPDEPTAGPALDGIRRLYIVDTRRQAPARRAGTRILVLDTSWTPPPGERDDLVPVRPLVARIVARHNLFDSSLDLLDDWAARAAVTERFTVRGVGWWSHARGFLRLVMHELLLWRHILDALVAPDWTGTISIPGGRRILAEAVRAGVRDGIHVEVRGGLLAEGTVARRGLRYLARRGRLAWYAVYPPRRTVDRQLGEAYQARIARSRANPASVLALVRDASFHVIEADGGSRRGDPVVGPVLGRLVDGGDEALQVVLGQDLFHDADAATVRDDEHAIPWGYVQHRWPARAGVTPSPAQLGSRLRAIPAEPLLVNGTNIGPAIRAHVIAQNWWLHFQALAMEQAEGLLAELRPSVLVTGWEAARTAWLGAARNAGVPVVAIQHGVIYPKTPDYVRPPDPALVRPALTCLFGPYERDLLVRDAGYAEGEVLATGSPRAAATSVEAPMGPEQRQALRRQLGVADGDRLLVVSTARHSVGDEFHSMAMVGELLDGPLPGVHVVFKLHPEETDGGRYPALLAGLAAAGGYAPTRASVTRDVDIYTLLRAADAHLGQYSTVLTDAVVTSTPNMIAVGQAWADVIGYVPAGVAAPVRSIDDVRAFMADPRPPEPEAREAFLQAHAIEGDAVGRIVTAIREAAARDGRAREVA